MRLLTVVAPGGEARQGAVSAALAAWNRALDIRLRFLHIGVEEAVLVLVSVPGPGEPAASSLGEVERAIERERPAMVLLHGGGPGALAAAVTSAKAGIPVVRTGAGRREGPHADEERAADRLAAGCLADDGAAMAALRGEGLGERSGETGPPADPGSAERVVKAVIRILRDL